MDRSLQSETGRQPAAATRESRGPYAQFGSTDSNKRAQLTSQIVIPARLASPREGITEVFDRDLAD